MTRSIVLFAMSIAPFILGYLWGWQLETPSSEDDWAYVVSAVLTSWIQITACPILLLMWLKASRDLKMKLGETLVFVATGVGQMLALIEGDGKVAAIVLWVGGWLIFGQNVGYYFNQ